MLYFIGAGAGDPELLTVKGKKIIDSSDIKNYLQILRKVQSLSILHL